MGGKRDNAGKKTTLTELQQRYIRIYKRFLTPKMVVDKFKVSYSLAYYHLAGYKRRTQTCDKHEPDNGKFFNYRKYDNWIAY